MRTNASPFRFVLCALCALAVWSAPAFSQRLDRGLEVDTIHSNAKARPNVPVEHALHDWTDNHMLYPRLGPMNRLITLQKDPRAVQHWQESYRKDFGRWRRGGEGHRSEHHRRSVMHRDWNISLGAGAIVGATFNPAVYPAKWTFDINESLATAASDTGACATDYLVVPINPIGVNPAGPGQPNIMGLNNLYSGTAGLSGNGVCNRNGGVATANDDSVSATTYFSYSVIGDDGVVVTSPVTSMDGNLIAFVEGTTLAGHFHVLAWKAGDGNNDAGVPAPPPPILGRQDAVTNAVQIGTGGAAFTLNAPLAASGTATDLTLNSTVSFSSPYIEYSDDVAYLGDDAGNIYRIKNVFCPTWAPCGTAQPSLDGTWGTGGVLATGCAGSVGSITVDGASGNIFAGCSDGNLYAFTPAGAAVAGSPLAVGDGNGVNGGIIDPPVLDVVNGWVYVETGSCITTLANCTTGGVGAGDPVLVQASLDLSTVNVATLGPGGNTFNIHAPAFNDAYFSSGTSTDWLLYEYSSDNAGPGGEIVLYGITFGVSPTHIMNAGAPGNSLPFVIGAFEISPLTEFLTTGTFAEDRLFAGAEGFAGPGNIVSFNITSGFPSGFESPGTEGTGTSGIVGDNVDSTSGQSGSVYFGVEGASGPTPSTVVKLTQVDLF